MNLRTTLIAGGLVAALGTGAAFAQSYSESAPPQQQMHYGHHHRHGHGVMALIREEVSAGRISQKEGTLLETKIKEMKRERRAERQARREGMESHGHGSAYDQGNPPPAPPSQK